jgi:hypothetical protein
VTKLVNGELMLPNRLMGFGEGNGGYGEEAGWGGFCKWVNGKGEVISNRLRGVFI